VSNYEWHGKGLVSLLTGGGDVTGIGASIAGIFAYRLPQHAISPRLNDLDPYKLEKGDIATAPSRPVVPVLLRSVQQLTILSNPIPPLVLSWVHTGIVDA